MSSFPSAAAQLGERSQQQSPLAMYAQLQQIRNAQQQGTALSQENQQRALELQDQQTLRSLAPNHIVKDKDGNVTGYDMPGLINEAAGKQVNPNTLTKMSNSYAESVKNLASASETVRNNEQAKNKAMYETLESLRGIQDPQKRLTTLQGALPSLQKQGVDTSKFQGSDVKLDDASLNVAEAGLGVHAQMLADAGTTAKTNLEIQQANLAKMEAAEKGSPLTKMENDPTMFAGDKLPASMAYLQSKVSSSDPEVASRAKRLLSVAETSQQNELALDKSKKAAAQAIADGDPVVAGKLLHDGLVAPSQIISARKPEFAQKAFTAATGYGDGWNAQKAEADFKVASSPAQVAFFGSAKSLTDKGGTLDQLAAIGKDIPQNEFKPFNTIEDAWKISVGSGPMAKYAAVALGVADDYAKVMGGGQGSDASRSQALKIIGEKLIPEERAGAIEGIRGAVGSQTSSRIGNNTVLKQMYGSQLPQAAKPAEAFKVPSDAPPAPKEDNKLLKSEGKVIAKSRGGQWVEP